jgi:hypothetical protein
LLPIILFSWFSRDLVTLIFGVFYIAPEIAEQMNTNQRLRPCRQERNAQALAMLALLPQFVRGKVRVIPPQSAERMGPLAIPF